MSQSVVLGAPHGYADGQQVEYLDLGIWYPACVIGVRMVRDVIVLVRPNGELVTRTPEGVRKQVEVADAVSLLVKLMKALETQLTVNQLAALWDEMEMVSVEREVFERAKEHISVTA